MTKKLGDIDKSCHSYRNLDEISLHMAAGMSNNWWGQAYLGIGHNRLGLTNLPKYCEELEPVLMSSYTYYVSTFLGFLDPPPLRPILNRRCSRQI